MSAFVAFQRITTCRRFSAHDRVRIFIEIGGGKTVPLGQEEQWRLSFNRYRKARLALLPRGPPTELGPF